MTIKFANIKAEMLSNSAVAAEYERLGPVYDLVGSMVEARHAAGLTQGDVAARIGTTQSAIARLENAHHLPSLSMLTKYAAAIGGKISLTLLPAE